MNSIGNLLNLDFWLNSGGKIPQSGSAPVITFILFTVFGALLTLRFRRLCRKWETALSEAPYRWRQMGLILVRRSVLILGAVIFLFGYDMIQFPHHKLPFVRFVLNLLIIVLFSRWFLVFFDQWQPAEGSFSNKSVISRIRMLAVGAGIVATVYAAAHLLASKANPLLFVLRLVLGLGLLFGFYAFWKAFQKARPRRTDRAMPQLSVVQSLVLFLTYLIPIGGLIIEFAGFSDLSIDWYKSWAQTAAVLFWAVIFFHIIWEWHSAYRKASRSAVENSSDTAHPVQMLFIEMAWLAWALAGIYALLLSWNTHTAVMNIVHGVMNKSWTLGKINLSLAGMVYALIILVFTHTLTRLLKTTLEDKLYTKSRMEPGLKASVSAISTYLLWGLGLVFALGVLGVSATSLAVVFGALSIGIGFGLQNIFNNFISGIILLFERPIQVGDAIEIGGIWGEVKKINVRATVVQTFDNASLIIPNSEFISSQVTNWSFKDQSMRRKLNVGVAYGSDVELVRKTLMEIADQTENVLKVPKPDVLFMDHGDSALIFTLRYWTTVDYYFSTSTEIRFAIDRLFGERGIVIAFPQRDIHIRSTVDHSAANEPGDAK